MHSPAVKKFPVALVAWGFFGMALHIGLARFTYGVTLPTLRSDLGISYFTGGALNAIHMAGYLIGTLAVPYWVKRAGMRGLALQAHLVVIAGAVICALAPSETASGTALLALGRITTGVGAGSAIVAILVNVFAAVEATQRPTVSAIVWAGMGASVVVSGLFVGWLLVPQIGWRTAFWAAAVLAALLACFAASRAFPANPPPATAPAAFTARDIATPRWGYLFVAYLMFGTGYIAYATFAGARLAALNAPLGVVSGVWTLYGLTCMIGAALTVPLVNSPRAKMFALVASLGCAAVGSLLAVATPSFTALLAALLVGLGLAATPTIVSGYARDRCSADDYPKAFAYASAAMGTGQLIGPVAAGALADAFGTAAAPLFAACAYGIGALMALMDRRNLKS
ncbi:major Facilitator Superfamily protein [Variibacter gotjawalensis]|uniref:Major Facilitator Superfamily protein n=1 Tax=Variibacter gotjawalensis TaxID=1333996 RepID=A0A0S3PWD1_9BRAD|nr:YbfB/YjiJ family MFS transporter [Variibacter gotjawalensis]NIK46046.1 putative MFS family arabinose efflux permease [Variibacter gotjawalensis]RZS47964.1 putative MFS family arabinose efflux permease [Variibacter gotjawalensis]BAT60220.1 major Facilitator Superfamily protein [Variibacter gotjawalensis]